MILSLDYLRRHLPLITDNQLREDLLEHGVLASFPENEVVLTDRQFIDYIPLVTKGGTKVVRRTPDKESLFLYFLQAGETCTMTLSSCLKREKSKVTAKTIAPTEIVLVPVERVYLYTRRYPSWNEFTLHSFQRKFDAILEAFEGLAFAGLEERLTHYLTTIANLRQDGTIPITHQELAEDMGASRVGLSRVLKKMEGDGKVRLGRGNIMVDGG